MRQQVLVVSSIHIRRSKPVFGEIIRNAEPLLVYYCLNDDRGFALMVIY